MSLPIVNDISAYNRSINISAPRFPDFDVRDFANNMKTVKLQMPAFRLSFFQLAILQSGGGTVNTDGKDRNLSPYTLFCNLPGQIIYWDVPRDWKGYYLNLTESFYTVPLTSYPRLPELPFFRQFTPAVQLTEEEADKFLSLFSILHQEYTEAPTQHTSIIQGLLNTLLAYAVTYFEVKAIMDLDARKQRGPAAQFQQLVRERITALALGLRSGSLAVADLADEIFVSAQHLSTVVKEATGSPPSEYIKIRLVQEAQKLLSATPLSIGEISDQLGFNDPAYFSRVFKKQTGGSPLQFRKRRQKAH